MAMKMGRGRVIWVLHAEGLSNSQVLEIRHHFVGDAELLEVFDNYRVYSCIVLVERC